MKLLHSPAAPPTDAEAAPALRPVAQLVPRPSRCATLPWLLLISPLTINYQIMSRHSPKTFTYTSMSIPYFVSCLPAFTVNLQPSTRKLNIHELEAECSTKVCCCQYIYLIMPLTSETWWLQKGASPLEPLEKDMMARLQHVINKSARLVHSHFILIITRSYCWVIVIVGTRYQESMQLHVTINHKY